MAAPIHRDRAHEKVVNKFAVGHTIPISKECCASRLVLLSCGDLSYLFQFTPIGNGSAKGVGAEGGWGGGGVG